MKATRQRWWRRRWPPPPPPPQFRSQTKGCAFCRTNGERREFYMGHTLRDYSGPGRAGRVTCPVLRGYKCPQCGYPGGDQAHTIRYCPLNRRGDLAPSVYNTPRQSNGRLRRTRAKRGEGQRRDQMRSGGYVPRPGSDWLSKTQSYVTGPRRSGRFTY
ncbi:uncharacterized protein LOC144094599 [Amblyomma americanum]